MLQQMLQIDKYIIYSVCKWFCIPNLKEEFQPKCEIVHTSVNQKWEASQSLVTMFYCLTEAFFFLYCSIHIRKSRWNQNQCEIRKVFLFRFQIKRSDCVFVSNSKTTAWSHIIAVKATLPILQARNRGSVVIQVEFSGTSKLASVATVMWPC